MYVFGLSPDIWDLRLQVWDLVPPIRTEAGPPAPGSAEVLATDRQGSPKIWEM